MENSHTMTGQDRVVLSNLLEKINAIHSLKEHDKFVFFLRKAMEEAKRRNAPHYYERFHTMLVTSKLSKRAFESRVVGRDIRATASGLKLANNVTIAVPQPSL